MAAVAVRSRRIIPAAGLKMAALERDAGFCSGEDEELDDMHSPTDASEDSVEVRVQPVASKSKRKCAEPRRFGEEAKRRLVDFGDGECGPFRPWSQVPSGYVPGEYPSPCGAQEEPLSLVLRETTPESSLERLSPPAGLGSGPRPQDVVRLRPSATVVRPKDAARTGAPLLTIRPGERIVRVPSVISVKSEFTDRALHVPSVTSVRPEDFERIPRPHPGFSVRSEGYEAALRVPPVTSVKFEEIERLPRVPSAASVRVEESDRIRVPSVTSASPEEQERVRLGSRTSFSTEEHERFRLSSRASFSTEERDRVPYSVRNEEADRVRPEECEKRAFSVESLMSDRAGPSTSNGKPPPTHQQQRNYKNMTRERRIEANARERTRVHTISAAFDTLRRAVPAYSHNQKLSKLSVLRIACSYILTLSRVAGDDYSADQSRPDLSDCVENVSRTIQMEGKLRKKRDE